MQQIGATCHATTKTLDMVKGSPHPPPGDQGDFERTGASRNPQHQDENFGHAKRLILVRKDKGKAVPLQVWTGPEGSSKLRLPDFVTTAQDRGKVVSLTHRPPLPPGNTSGTHFC